MMVHCGEFHLVSLIIFLKSPIKLCFGQTSGLGFLVRQREALLIVFSGFWEIVFLLIDRFLLSKCGLVVYVFLRKIN